MYQTGRRGGYGIVSTDHRPVVQVISTWEGYGVATGERVDESATGLGARADETRALSSRVPSGPVK